MAQRLSPYVPWSDRAGLGETDMADTTQWRPAAGQIALIEPVDASPGRDCLTGVVVPGERILIDLGASPRPESDAAEVVASFFAPDALYRLFAKAHQDGGGLMSLDVSALERVQRRANPRVQVVLPIRLGVGDQEEASVLTGETVDLPTGGCRGGTDRPWPPQAHPELTVGHPHGAAGRAPAPRAT